MAITGSLITKDKLLNLISQFSSKTHDLNYQTAAFLKLLAQLSDGQVETILVDGGIDAGVAATMRADIRNWQASIANYVQNYTGDGSLNDASYELAKRYYPQI